MSIILELLTHALAKAGFSSSQEEEVLESIRYLNTPPESKEESSSENPCACEGEQVFEQEIDEDEQEIEEDHEELQHDLRSENYAYKSPIERWFQASMRLEQFSFSFLVRSQTQQLNLFIFVYFHCSFMGLKDNIFLLLLRVWLHWLFDYT